MTDYRITDFGEFMRENRLAPCQETPDMEEAEEPIERGEGSEGTSLDLSHYFQKWKLLELI